MITGNSFGEIWLNRAIAGLALGLLLLPSSLSARAVRLQSANAGEQSAEAQRDADEARQERELEKRDREQEARDREQEKRDAEQEKVDHQQELYDDGREALDDDHYEKAVAEFAELAKLNGPQTDAALY